MVIMKFAILFIFCSQLSFLSAVSLNEKIVTIPLEDRKALEELFRDVVNNDHFGYTLYGDKPVSIAAHFRVTPWENTLELGQCDGLFWKRWEIWEKYKDKFPSSNYLLLREKNSASPLFFSDMVVLINKGAFLQTIKRYLLIFESVLKQKVIPEQFLAQIEEGKKTFLDSILDHDLLLGILLGYGQHNATLFCHKDKIFKQTCLGLYARSKRFPLIIQDLSFAADLQHPETKYLKKKYDHLRGVISAIYAKEGFLVGSLSRFT